LRYRARFTVEASTPSPSPCGDGRRCTQHDESDDEYETVYEYRSTAREVAERLDVMGFTMREAEERFADGAEYVAEMADSWAEYEAKLASVTGEHSAAARRIDSERGRVRFLRSLEFGEWLDAVREVVTRRHDADVHQGNVHPEELTDPILDYVQNEGDEWAPFGFPNDSEIDLRTVVRVMLAVVDPESEVVLDYTDLLSERRVQSLLRTILAASVRFLTPRSL